MLTTRGASGAISALVAARYTGGCMYVPMATAPTITVKHARMSQTCFRSTRTYSRRCALSTTSERSIRSSD